MLTLYTHIPFCEKKCFYCSFVVSVGQKQRTDQYIDALKQEAGKYQNKVLDALYLGGGTPSFLSCDQLESLFKFLHSHFQIKDGAEITIEVNPEDVSQDKLKILHQCGVNRISLGVQTFNESYLKYLGRIHNAAKVLQAYPLIKKSGFSNVSLDLMFGFPHQSIEEIEADLNQIQSLSPEHVSVYSLTIEQNSRFFVKKVQLAQDSIQAQQYEFVVRRLKEIGFSQYEVSNFAKPGKQSAHNMNYWQGGDYIGLGVGAHSHFNGTRQWNVSRLIEYLDKIKKGQSVVDGQEILNSEKRFQETFLFGLRMNQGVCLSELQERFGISFQQDQLEQIKMLVENGLLDREDNRLKATDKGRLVLDEISARLI